MDQANSFSLNKFGMICGHANVNTLSEVKITPLGKSYCVAYVLSLARLR